MQRPLLRERRPKLRASPSLPCSCDNARADHSGAGQVLKEGLYSRLSVDMTRPRLISSRETLNIGDFAALPASQAIGLIRPR
jgi:hypothetical protein